MKTGTIAGALLLVLGCLAVFCRYALAMTFAAGFAAGPDSDLIVNDVRGTLAATLLGTVLTIGLFVLWRLRGTLADLPGSMRRRGSFVFPSPTRSAFGFRKLRY